MSQTADRYAKALFETAKEQNKLEPVQEAFSVLRKLIADSDEFRNLLSNPLLSCEERSSVLKALFEHKAPDILFKFLLFITYKSRLDILKNIIESFDNMYLAQTNKMRAYVKTALPITDADKAFISQHLQDKFHQQMLVRWTIDPTLIGGFRIFAQGKIYDYSFKDQLNNFYQQTTQLV